MRATIVGVTAMWTPEARVEVDLVLESGERVTCVFIQGEARRWLEALEGATAASPVGRDYVLRQP